MLRSNQSQQFRYSMALFAMAVSYSLLIGLGSAITFEYLAFVQIKPEIVLLRAIFAALGIYVPLIAVLRTTFYLSRITLDPCGITVQNPLRTTFVSWSDIYALERHRNYTIGGTDLNASYEVVVNTGVGPRKYIICDEMLPNYERLIQQIRQYAPRAYYRDY